MARIEFKQISKSYGSGLPLTINQVDLVIEDGRFCVFVGPSGCGKSTLLRMVAGLESISAGELSIAGRRVNELPPAQRGIAMVFQSYALYPHMTVAQNMAFGLEVQGLPQAEIARKIAHAAEILQLTPLLERRPRQLSGGQRQRVAIGRAIVKQPDVFLFDEPLSNLDAALRVQTRLEIARLHQGIGTASMIYVTHDQVEAMTLADQIVLLRAGPEVQTRGSVAQVGTPMDLYHRPANRFVAEFIGSPRMNILPGRLLAASAGQALVDVAGTTIAVAVDARAGQIGAPVSLGIRPEHLQAGAASPGAAEGAGAHGAHGVLATRVDQFERLGDVTMLYLDVGAGLPGLTLRVDGHAPQGRGEALALTLPAGRCHLFDAAGDAYPRTVATPA
ncbi:MAG: sn-glycerol-3-phosphate transporter ATP-binding protein UgpC [Pseudomonadota bacterium]|jgi:multiple sugar transport system ATP-binding protein